MISLEKYFKPYLNNYNRCNNKKSGAFQHVVGEKYRLSKIGFHKIGFISNTL